MTNAVTPEMLNNVAAALGTTDKNFVYSAVLATLVKNGICMDVAWDAVFGEGAYVAFAGNLYDALRSEK